MHRSTMNSLTFRKPWKANVKAAETSVDHDPEVKVSGGVTEAFSLVGVM